MTRQKRVKAALYVTALIYGIVLAVVWIFFGGMFIGINYGDVYGFLWIAVWLPIGIFLMTYARTG